MTDWEGQQYVQVGLHGRRRGGIDANDYLRLKGHLVNTVSATTASVGVEQEGTVILSSKASVASFQAPRKGLKRMIVTITTSTLARALTLASGTFSSTAGSSQAKATFNGQGQMLDLVGLSTALWHIRRNIGVTLATAT